MRKLSEIEFKEIFREETDTYVIVHYLYPNGAKVISKLPKNPDPENTQRIINAYYECYAELTGVNVEYLKIILD